MTCKDYRKKLYLGAQEKNFLAHVEGCPECQKEAKSIERLDGLLGSSFYTIEPSKNFEQVFWQKVLERQKEPWFVRLLKELDSLIPRPSAPQMAMVALMAFLIGSTGGVVSAMNSTGSLEAERNSVQYLSGFREFKGLPTSSVAASYLKVIEDPSADV